MSFEPEPRLEIRWREDVSVFDLRDVHAAQRALFELTLANRRCGWRLAVALARLTVTLNRLHPTAIPYP